MPDSDIPTPKADKKNNDTISVKDLAAWQDSLKKDFDFDINTPDNELNPDQLVKKIMYQTLDDSLGKAIGPEAKKTIDEARRQNDVLSKFKLKLDRFTDLGKEVEKNFLWQFAYLTNHWDKKSQDNHFHIVVRNMTTKIVEDKTLSSETRVSTAKKILEVIEAYKSKAVSELESKQEIISALLPAAETAFSQIDFEIFDREIGKGIDSKQMKENGEAWLSLSKDLLKNRALAIEAVKEDLNMDEFIPKHIIKSEGDITKNVSAMEMKLNGERMVKLLSEADKNEKEIQEKRGKISEDVFGKPEEYMDMPKENKTPDVPVKAVKTNSSMSTWKGVAISLVLFFLAIFWTPFAYLGLIYLGIVLARPLFKK